tara:strand:+ start:193 stop:402 length:210 start_codon:yes stop_codon:yes gene_type:complete
VDYRNVCYFLIFVLGLFCYDLYKQNQKLKELLLDQDAVVQDLQKSLATWNYYYHYLDLSKSRSSSSPVH